MTKSELKKAVEQVAKERDMNEIDVITEMQSGAAITNNEAILELLCDLKWDYIV